MDEANIWRLDLDEIAAHLINYYNDLFTSSNPTVHRATLTHIPSVITEHMNESLIALVHGDKEIGRAHV